MKNILFISIISLLFFSACEKHSLEINDNNPAFNLPKFPEEIINVNTHNYMPEMAIEKWENGNIKPFGQNNLSRATEILKDSLWKNDFGRTIYAQADESIILPNLQKYIFPGSLLKGNTISDCNYTPISTTINPITVSVSFPAKKVVGTIEKPSLSATRSFVNDVLQQEGIGSQNSSLNFNIDQFTSYDELRMAFGSNAKTSALFFSNTSSSSEKVQKISKKTGLYVRFVQRNFTIDMDIPSSGSLINGHLTSEQTGGYSPVYAASITYGRMGILAIETDYTYTEAHKIIEQAFKTIFYKKSSTLTDEAKRMLSSATMRVYLIGGDGQSGAQTVNGYQDFIRHISEGGTFNSMTPGVPIYCSFAYLSDNAPVKIKFKINVSSDPVYARIEYRNMDGKPWSNYRQGWKNGDVYIAFYSDLAATTRTEPASFIKFKYRQVYRYQRCQDAKWDDLIDDEFKVEEEGFIQNTYKENSILLFKQMCLQLEENYDPDVLFGQYTWFKEWGCQLTEGDYYKILKPIALDSRYKYDVWPEENY
ncbi:thiol-activated cytolysin family protein [Butyricimonas muris]|uniref:thiol-activated cytolysin family protein n=2 Tax=Butyricimonas TaxID=574697 RepID=UPI003967D6F4